MVKNKNRLMREVLPAATVAAITLLGATACSDAEPTAIKKDSPAAFVGLHDLTGNSERFEDEINAFGDPLHITLPRQEDVTLVYGHEHIGDDYIMRASTAMSAILDATSEFNIEITEIGSGVMLSGVVSAEPLQSKESAMYVGTAKELGDLTSLVPGKLNKFKVSTFVGGKGNIKSAVSIVQTDTGVDKGNLGSDKLDPIKLGFITEMCQNALIAQLVFTGAHLGDTDLGPALLSDPGIMRQSQPYAQEHLCNSISRAVAFALAGEPYEKYVASAKAHADEINTEQGYSVPKYIIPESVYADLLKI